MLKKMRVLLTADPGLPVPPKLYGGIERVVSDLCKSLTKKGYDVGLLAEKGSTANVAELYTWPDWSKNKSALPFCLALQKATNSFDPDVVHSFSRILYLAPILRQKIPKIMSYQREPTRRSICLANALAKRNTMFFTGCSHYITQRGSRGDRNWATIPNCIDENKFNYAESVNPSAPLVFLSRVEEIKGAHLAIDVAQQSGRKLLIAGNHSATPKDANYWQTKVAPRIDGERIVYVGPVDDEQKKDLLCQAAALLVPIQWNEPFGIVFIEALASGTPILSCPRGALPSIVDRSEIGVLSEDMSVLVAAAKNPAMFNRAECRAVAMERYTASTVASEYESVYNHTLKVGGS